MTSFCRWRHTVLIRSVVKANPLLLLMSRDNHDLSMCPGCKTDGLKITWCYHMIFTSLDSSVMNNKHKPAWYVQLSSFVVLNYNIKFSLNYGLVCMVGAIIHCIMVDTYNAHWRLVHRKKTVLIESHTVNNYIHTMRRIVREILNDVTFCLAAAILKFKCLAVTKCHFFIW